VATNALPQHAVPRPLRTNPPSDRIFFSLMVLLLWATVLFGFAKTYFLAGMVRAPLPNILIHIHGAAFTLWMVLLLVQEGLIAGRKVKWHMQLGLAGFALAATMVLLGLLAAVDSLRRGATVPGLDSETFFIVPITAIAIFAVMVWLAYRFRYSAATHKRLILIATIGIMDAAVGRWPVAFFEHYPKTQDLVPLAFLLAVMAYDLISLRRIQKATLWASLFVIAVHLTRVPIGQGQPWQRFANHMAIKG
jgi:hypothetical protein